METQENLTEETQPSAETSPAEGGQEAVPEPEALSLAEINEITGMQYKSKDAALKSIKDMKSQAGKVSDLEGRAKQADETDTQWQERVEQLEADNFYARNTDHETNRDLIEALAKAHGVSRAEAIDLPAYKNVYEKIQGFDESQSKRTVADSNSRVAQSSPTNDELEDAVGDREKSADFVTKHFFNQ